MRRILSTLIATAALAALSIPTAPGRVARAATQAWTQSGPQSYTVSGLGPNANVACSMSYYLFTPNPMPAKPVPAILETNGFGGSKDDQLLTDAAKYFASQGYIVLDYSGLGFDGSRSNNCQIELDSPEWDGRAAVGLIDGVLGRQPKVLKDHSGPVVGMLGGSYGGGIQFTTASMTPAVRAIAPIITWNDLAYSLTPNNNDIDLVHRDRPPGTPKFEWTELFFGVGATEPIQNPSAAPPTTPTAFTCPGFDPAVCTANVSSVVNGYPSQSTIDLLRHSSMVSYGSSVHIPTLLMQGEADTLFNINEAVANYNQIKATGAPVKLVLQSWGHSQSTPATNELNIGNLANPGYEGLLVKAWFDRYLKGDSTVSTGAPVEYFRDWVYAQTQDAVPAYAQAPAWPVGSTQTLALSGGNGGSLETLGTAVASGSASFANPPGGAPASYSETSGVQNRQPWASIPPSDTAGTYAAWSTPPLAADTDSIGIPTASINLGALLPPTTTDSQPTLFLKLYDVAPDGSLDLVERLVSPVRPDDLSQPVHVTLPGVVHRYPAGHRIRFVAAATDSAHIASRAANTYTISTSAAAPSTVTLPVLSPATFVGG